MVTDEIVAGQETAWSLIKKMGEGDAGEVFLAESLLDKKLAVLKRPCRSAFTSEVLRQASQIERESRILRALATLDLPSDIHILTPRLLDRSEAGAHNSERFFIVMTPAPGFDLSYLARVARFGQTPQKQQITAPSSAERAFLTRLATRWPSNSRPGRRIPPSRCSCC